MKRGEDGTFNDEDLGKILHDASVTASNAKCLTLIDGVGLMIRLPLLVPEERQSRCAFMK